MGDPGEPTPSGGSKGQVTPPAEAPAAAVGGRRGIDRLAWRIGMVAAAAILAIALLWPGSISQHGSQSVAWGDVVQAMRKTRQTSEFINQMGPFFVGRAAYRHAG